MLVPKLPKISFMSLFKDVCSMSVHHSSKFSTGNMHRSSGPDLRMEFDPVTLTVAPIMKVTVAIPFPANSAA
jgi:hypothetical protein